MVNQDILKNITLISMGILVIAVICFGKRKSEETVIGNEDHELSGGWISRFLNRHSPKLFLALFIIVFTGVLVSSFNYIYSPLAVDNWNSLLLLHLKDKWIVFLVNILIKMFLLYVIVFVSTSFFTIDKFQKFSLELPGFKIAAERAAHEKKAVILSEIVVDNIEVMQRFNELAAQYLSSVFEPDILDVKSKAKTAENIHIKIDNLLQEVYGGFENIVVKVFSPTHRALNANLTDPALGVVRPALSITEVGREDQVGFIAYNQVEGLGTVVVLDATKSKYDLCDAEVQGVAMFVSAFINIIAWAEIQSLS